MSSHRNVCYLFNGLDTTLPAKQGVVFFFYSLLANMLIIVHIKAMFITIIMYENKIK